MLTFEIFDSLNNVNVNIYVGQNSTDNWKIFDNAKQNDIWFHLNSFSSPYVIINTLDYKSISKEIHNYAAQLCKEYSKMNKINNLCIIYTQIGNLRKGVEIGSVIIKKNNLVEKIYL